MKLWNDLDALRNLSYWLGWVSIVLIFLGGLMQAARLAVERREKQLVREQEEKRIMQQVQKETELKGTILRLTDELAKSESKIKNLEHQTKSRRLDQDVARKMLNVLSAAKGQKIILTSIMGDVEALQLASQLKEVFEAAGWAVDGVNQAVFTGPVTGLLIKVASEQYPKRIERVVSALKMAGFEPQGVLDQQLGNDSVEIVIGGRP